MEENLETHLQEIDILYNASNAKISEKFSEESELVRKFKTHYRLFRKILFSYIHPKDKNFKNILYITMQNPPIDYISAFRKQYPDKKFRILMPVKNPEGLTKLNQDFDFSIRNIKYTASLYKFKDIKENIEIYGVHSAAFDEYEPQSFQYLALFAKVVRHITKKFKPDIVHSDNFPFFLGSEFEGVNIGGINVKRVNTGGAKVLLTVNDFSKFELGSNLCKNIMYQTLKQANGWAALSKTYYEELLENPELSGVLFDIIKKRKRRSSWVSYGYEDKEQNTVYKQFTQENFKEYRARNKKYLVREFSKARIRTNFIDTKFFENKEHQIKGYLEASTEVPLIFCKFSTEIFPEGADIALTVLLKLLEENKNAQVIINMPEGLQNKSVQSWVEYLEQKEEMSGKWLFIDGKINLSQFYASSDLTLLPARENPTSELHLLALKYGCIPVTSRNGIYNDTVIDIFDDMTLGCGFKTKTKLVNDEDSFTNFLKVTEKALNLYTNNPSSWNLLIKNAMNIDSGWNFEVIEQFNTIYNKL